MPRIDRLNELLRSSKFQGIVLNPGPTLTYLTGLHFHLMERPTVLIIKAGETPVLVLPELESSKLGGAFFDIKPFTFGDNPAQWPDAFERALASLDMRSGTVAVEPTRLRYLELDYLMQAAPALQFKNGDSLLSNLRMIKDSSEVGDIRQAIRIAEQAFLETIKVVRPGMTEREVAAELTLQLIRHGSDSEFPFAPIIASGPNSANPHAVPTDRRLQPGDLVVVDWGAASNGYISDLTRTLAIGEVDDELRKIASIVASANAAGRQAGVPGLPAGAVDAATRKVIDQAGYGSYFIHRTGHGIGMEGHEPPYIFGENTLELMPGMTFTIEPGIYLPDRGGVRIEDNVLVTAEGLETLSTLPRELYDIPV